MNKRRVPKDAIGRRRAFRDPRPAVYIVCEGKLTEPEYFEAYARFVGNGLVRTKYYAGAGAPITVVNRALELRASLQRTDIDSFARKDAVWAVFDRDAHPSFSRAVDKAEANKLSYAYSNPCFEVWLVLHYQDFDAPIDHTAVQKLLQTLAPEYDRKRSKTVDFSTLSPQVDSAEKRAGRLVKRRIEEGSPKGRPCTNVDELTACLRRFSGGTRPRTV